MCWTSPPAAYVKLILSEVGEGKAGEACNKQKDLSLKKKLNGELKREKEIGEGSEEGD